MDPVSFCPKCGHILEDGGNYCPVCGTVVPDPPRFEKLSFEEAVEGSFKRLEQTALRGYARRLETARHRLDALERELEQIIELPASACRQ